MSLYTHYSELPVWKASLVFASEINTLVGDKLDVQQGNHFDTLLKYASSIPLKIATGFRSMKPPVFRMHMEEVLETCLQINAELRSLHAQGRIKSAEKSNYKGKIMMLYRSLERIKRSLDYAVETEEAKQMQLA